MSGLLSGTKEWTHGKLKRFMSITGSYAPRQWQCMDDGGEFYIDPTQSRRAQLMAELASLDDQEAA